MSRRSNRWHRRQRAIYRRFVRVLRYRAALDELWDNRPWRRVRWVDVQDPRLMEQGEQER